MGEKMNDVKSSVTLLFPEVELDGSWENSKADGWGSRIGLGERSFHLGPEGLESPMKLTTWGDAEWGVFIVR